MVNPELMPPKDIDRIKEISEDILKSMLKRSYPAVDASHYFKKYADGKTPDPQFMHALAMMDHGKIIRMDTTKKPFSVTFVLLENGKPKMHHMIDDDYGSNTFGSMINDPYEGIHKRQTCYKHLEEGLIPGCEKCLLEKNSQICMKHNNILSECVKCQESTSIIKKDIKEDDAPEFIKMVLETYKYENWSFEK